MKFISQYRGLKKEIYILFLGKMITALGAFVFPLFTLLMKSKLNYSASQIALVFSISTLLSLPASLVGGKLTDRLGRKKIIVFFDLISIGLFFAGGLIPLSDLTIALFVLSGLASTIGGPAYTALISDFSDSKNREKAFSLSYLGYNLGFILGPALGGFLFEEFFQLAVILNSFALLTSTLLIVFFVSEKKTFQTKDIDLPKVENSYEDSQEHDSIWTVVRQRKVVLLAILGGSLGGIVYGVSNLVLPLALDSLFGTQGPVYNGLMSSFNGLIVILFTPLLTIYLSPLKELPKMMVGVFLFMGGIVFYGFSSDIIFMFLGMFVFTVGEVINSLGSSPYISRRIPMSHRGRIISVYSIIGTVVTVIAQQGTGWLLDHYPFNYLWIMLFIVGGIGIIVYGITLNYDKKQFPKLY